jgi:hypothetical protein
MCACVLPDCALRLLHRVSPRFTTATASVACGAGGATGPTDARVQLWEGEGLDDPHGCAWGGRNHGHGSAEPG